MMNENNTKIFILAYKQFNCPIHNANLYRIVDLKDDNIIKNDGKYHYDVPILYTDKGDTISNKNDMFDEWSGIYWLWKNYDFKDTEYVGLCQYRRYFEFLDQPNFDIMKDFEMVIGQERNSRNKDNYQDFKSCHNINELLSLLTFTEGEDRKYAHKFLESHTFFPSNLLIMKKEHFFKFCEFVFGITQKYCEKENLLTYNDVRQRIKSTLSNYNIRKSIEFTIKYQSQLLAFLMERLTNIWLLKQIDNGKKILCTTCVETEYTGQNTFKPLYKKSVQ